VLVFVSQPVTAGEFDNLVSGILTAWDSADVVCLGEGHSQKNDSDLRIALVQHPEFVQRVDVIVVEFANPVHQGILDRLVVDGENVSRAELRQVWRDASSPWTWESPVYEAFLRTVRQANLVAPRHQRVRVIGGDAAINWAAVDSAQDLVPLVNRGGVMRQIIAEEVLDKGLKALAIYGSRHCEKRGGGFPGELESRYPGRFWVAFSFARHRSGVENGRKVFNLGPEPRLIQITGTSLAGQPAEGMFIRTDSNVKVGHLLDAIVYFGDRPDSIVERESIDFEPTFLLELERRARLTRAAHELWLRGASAEESP